MIASRLNSDIENLLLIALEQGASIEELHGIVEWVEDYYSRQKGQTMTKCPSCQAIDNNPYIDQHGAEMRACGRCMIQWRVRDPFGNAQKFSGIVPENIQRLYDRCCELEEHVASHDLKEFERCAICEENGEARRADIAYENAAVAWVNGLCGHNRAQSGKNGLHSFRRGVLSPGWVHDGDAALNPQTGERIPYDAS